MKYDENLNEPLFFTTFFLIQFFEKKKKKKKKFSKKKIKKKAKKEKKKKKKKKMFVRQNLLKRLYRQVHIEPWLIRDKRLEDPREEVIKKDKLNVKDYQKLKKYQIYLIKLSI